MILLRIPLFTDHVIQPIQVVSSVVDDMRCIVAGWKGIERSKVNVDLALEWGCARSQFV